MATMPELSTAARESGDAAVIAELAERAADLKAYPLTGGEDALVIARTREDERIGVTNLEQYLPAPQAPRGAATLHDPAHFVEYVNRLGNDQRTTVWCDVDRGTIRAVLDDHRDYATAGWREHTVTLQLTTDVDWIKWTNLNEKLVPQVQFARHIEDTLHTIVNPPAADMLEVATSLQAHRTASFAQATKLSNNDIQLAYHEETTAKAGGKGNLEVPRQFTVHIGPWVGCPFMDVDARLRYAIDGGVLRIGYGLIRPDLVQREIFESVVATIRDQLSTKAVFNGTAPTALR